MILETTMIGKKKNIRIKCEKSNKIFNRVLDIGEDLGNIEKSLCDDEINKLKEWLKNKDVLKANCWCKHINDFISS